MTNTSPDHDIAVSRAVESLDEEPDEREIARWIDASLTAMELPAKEVSVRIVSADEITQLNADYRNKPNPTNVLSFPANLDLEGLEILGDIVICNSVVKEEAATYGLGFNDRYAHMVIHGLLHLLGHDHEEEEERLQMESIEKKLLAGLGVMDPYLDDSTLQEGRA